MKSFAIIALAGVAAAMPQGITEKIAPEASAPDSCKTTYSDPFSISIMNVTTSASKRSLVARQEPKVLTITLADGVLTDDQGRTGYIAANNQFQFDKPAQTGAIYTSGWSVCSNGTLALGDSAIFYQCLSGDFYNLYDQSTGNQCSQIYINILNAGGASASAGGASQIGDGQLQAATSTAGAVSQISDGQIQATTSTAAPVTQISDGQIQASTAAATTAAPVTQIADGQIQASTGTAVVSQISDGQIQAPTNGTGVATASPTIQAFTGAAALPTMRAELFGLAGAALAAVAML